MGALATRALAVGVLAVGVLTGNDVRLPEAVGALAAGRADVIANPRPDTASTAATCKCPRR